MTELRSEKSENKEDNLTEGVAVKSMEFQGEDLASEGAKRAAAIVSVKSHNWHIGQTADKVS